MKYKVSAGTIARTVILALALLNQVLTVAGYSPIPIDDETINLTIASVWTIVASVVAWWKNQSFTQAAIEGDEVMRGIKKGA